jgi:radical SAM protein with 4Fe4S-binding SPASM domain
MFDLYYLDENMVQIWEEHRYEKIFLLNHRWRTRDEVLKKGFKLFFQQVTREQLQALRELKYAKTENEYMDLEKLIGESLFRKLLKYDYLVKESTEKLNKQVWHSQAGEHLYKYLKSMYGIDYPERPSRVLLLPTMRCTGKCIFCITNSKPNNGHHEMDIDTWRDIAYRVCDELQPCSVDVVGGEPLIRYDIVLEIAKILSAKNTLIKIITNGLAFTNKERVNELYAILKNAKHNIQISLDGFKEAHNTIRPGVDFDKVIEAICNVSQAGLTFGINLTINKLNLNNIENLMSEIIQYGPSYILVGPLQVSPKDIELCKKIMINNEEEKQLREVIERIIENHPNIVIKYDKDEPVYEKESIGMGNRKRFHTCTGFIEEMSIGPEGNLISCLRGTAYEELWGPNIVRNSSNYADHWLSSDLAELFRTIPISGKCAVCEYNQQCNQGCPLETYVLEGLFGGFDPHCIYIPASLNKGEIENG